jgi:hypothetical protein
VLPQQLLLMLQQCMPRLQLLCCICPLLRTKHFILHSLCLRCRYLLLLLL